MVRRLCARHINSTSWAILFCPSVGLRILSILVIYFLYFTLLEGHCGQTVGKMPVKIKVVKEADGSPIDYGLQCG